MIPKVIHYCWFGGKPLPNDVKKSINSWKKKCPNYEIIQWNEKNFDVYENEFCKEAYRTKNWAFVSDYARLKIIYNQGGIYLDTDVELIKNLDFLLNEKAYFGIQQQDYLVATGLGFGAEKNNKLVYTMLKQYESLIFDESKKEKFACPLLNTNALKQEGYISDKNNSFFKGARIFIPEYFDPYAPGENKKNLFSKNTVSIHHYSASWLSKKNIYKRKLIRIIGQKNINNIKRLIYHDK